MYDLDYNEQVKISYAFNKKTASKGTRLFEEGKPMTEVILIRGGEIELEKTLKIDLFDIENQKDIGEIEKSIMRMKAKSIYGIKNDVSWT